MAPLHLDFTVDLSTDGAIRTGASKVLSQVRPQWDNQLIQWKIFTDGITNKLIGGWLQGNKEDIVLVRVYGEGTDKIIDREEEMRNMERMQNIHCGSILYASFNNGISYEFLSGEILSQRRLWEPEVWHGVVKMFSTLHRMPLEKEEQGCPCLWSRLLKFINCSNPTCRPRLAEEFLSKEELINEVTKLQKRLENCDDAVVFCHNDALLNNIVLQKDRVRFIDLEYGAANYAAFDIANHYCEFVGCDGVLDYATWLPKKDWQLEWLKKYLEVREERDVKQEEVERLQSNVEHFMLAAHLLWAVWAVIQAENSSIDFDFEDYALQRLQEFKRWKLYLKVD